MRIREIDDLEDFRATELAESCCLHPLAPIELRERMPEYPATFYTFLEYERTVSGRKIATTITHPSNA